MIIDAAILHLWHSTVEIGLAMWDYVQHNYYYYTLLWLYIIGHIAWKHCLQVDTCPHQSKPSLDLFFTIFITLKPLSLLYEGTLLLLSESRVLYMHMTNICKSPCKGFKGSLFQVQLGPLVTDFYFRVWENWGEVLHKCTNFCITKI